MATSKRVIINTILEGKDDEINTDYDKFLELKALLYPTKPNTEVIKSCIRSTHKLLFG